MNDETLERELRGWYRAEVDETLVAPSDLREDVRAIPGSITRVGRPAGTGRGSLLLIAAAVATTAVVGSAIVGSGIIHVQPTVPRPSAVSAANSTPSAAASATVATPPPSPTPSSIPGGAQILAALPHPGARPCNTTAAPYDVVSIDPATGKSTLLATTSSECSVRSFSVDWASDRHAILLLGSTSPRQLGVATVTDAGRRLPVLCCDLPPESVIWQGGGGSGQGWGVSPHGDRIAAVHTSRSGPGDGILVSDIDGRNVKRLMLPDGADARAGFAWSPDESTIAVAACRPCDTAQPGQTPTAAERWHLYLVPVDGSPIRALVTGIAGGTVSQPSWSPDGSSIAVVMTKCAAGESPPACMAPSRSSLAIVDVASNASRTILSGTDVGPGLEIVDPSWAPDVSRIRLQAYDVNSDRTSAYVVDVDGSNVAKVADGRVVAWSPDGDWFLVGHGVGADDISIGRIDGTVPERELGSFTSVDW